MSRLVIINKDGVFEDQISGVEYRSRLIWTISPTCHYLEFREILLSRVELFKGVEEFHLEASSFLGITDRMWYSLIGEYPYLFRSLRYVFFFGITFKFDLSFGGVCPDYCRGIQYHVEACYNWKMFSFWLGL